MCHKHLPMTTLKNRSDHAVTKLCLIYPPKLQCFCWGTWWLWDAMGIHLAHISGHPMALSHWYFASSKETSSPFEGSYLGSKMSKSTMFGPGAGWKYHAFLMVPLQISSVLNRWTSKIPYDCWWTPPFSHRSWLLGPSKKNKNKTCNFPSSDMKSMVLFTIFWATTDGSFFWGRLHFEAHEIGIFILLLDTQSLHHLIDGGETLEKGRPIGLSI